MREKLHTHFDNITEDGRNYLESLVEYYKLDTFKKSAKATSALLRFIIVGGIFLLMFAFISIGIAILVGDLIGHLYVGFFIVAGVNLLLMIFMATKGRKIIDRLVLRIFSEIFVDEDQATQIKK
ncbi:MAG: phage holin family protein [Bacteroidota bacterium]